MTVGDRLSNGSYGEENDRAFHGFGNDLVRWLIKKIYGFAFDDVMTGYRAFNRVFVKTMPVLSEGFQIETEISIHAVDKRWRIEDVPIDYRDRPEGSYSKLSTFGDGAKVLKAITSLFKDYRPLAFFGWLALILLVLAVAVLGGGAAFYFKVYRPKQQTATEPEEDYGEELEDYDGEEDGPPWDEDEEENEETEDGE